MAGVVYYRCQPGGNLVGGANLYERRNIEPVGDERIGCSTDFYPIYPDCSQRIQAFKN